MHTVLQGITAVISEFKCHITFYTVVFFLIWFLEFYIFVYWVLISAAIIFSYNNYRSFTKIIDKYIRYLSSLIFLLLFIFLKPSRYRHNCVHFMTTLIVPSLRKFDCCDNFQWLKYFLWLKWNFQKNYMREIFFKA